MNVGIIVDIIRETGKNWRFVIESPLHDAIQYKAGQLIQLLAKSPTLGDIIRNYSLSSWPDGTNRLEIIVTRLDGGKMSHYLFNEVKIGDEVWFRGPMGSFVLPEDLTGRSIYMVSTGSGISPFRSMINWIHTNGIEYKEIKLFFGTRTQADLLYRDEMLGWYATRYPKFHYIPVLSREKWVGKTGYVHEHYLELIDSGVQRPLVYFCGWDAVITDGRARLAERGFKLGEDIRVELFG
jgi:ferredoxin-NADP reductase